MSLANKIGIGLTVGIIVLLLGVELYQHSGPGREARVRAIYDAHKQDWMKCENLFRETEAQRARLYGALKSANVQQAVSAFQNQKTVAESWLLCDYEFKKGIAPEVNAAGVTDIDTRRAWTRWLETVGQAEPAQESVDVGRLTAELSKDPAGSIAAQYVMLGSESLHTIMALQRLDPRASPPKNLGQ